MVGAMLRRLVPALLLLAACKVKDPPPITHAWSDVFDRDAIGGNYYQSGPGYAVTGGALSAHGAHDHPLWLRKRLPHDVRVELDCWSNDPQGDLEVELFGDGKSYDPDGRHYTATGYEVIFGGWANSKSLIARLDDHGKDVVARELPHVAARQHYHWKIERRGRRLSWFVDDMHQPFLVYDDPHPLEDNGHEYFAFDDDQTDTWFDNLVVTPL
jgi:hypothetical protein